MDGLASLMLAAVGEIYTCTRMNLHEELKMAIIKESLEINHSGPEETEETSFGTCVFNLINSTMGSGILGLSFALANTGILLYLILLILMGLMTTYSIYLMLLSGVRTGLMNYEEVGEKLLGLRGKYFVFVTIFLHNLGGILSYLFIIKEETPSIIKAIIGKDETFLAWYLDERLLIIVVTIIFIFPLCLLKTLGYLGYPSSISVVCMMFFLMVVIIKKFQISCSWIGKEPSGSEESCEAKFFVINTKSVYALPTIAFSFVCHQVIYPIYSELERASLKRMMLVTYVSLGIVFLIYLTSSVFGYLTFYDHVHPNLLNTYHGEDSFILLVRMAVSLAIIFTVPMLYITSRNSLNQMVEERGFNFPERMLIAAVTLSLCVLLVILIPSLKDIFGVLGATTANMMIFIIPSILFFKVANSKNDRYSRKLVAFFLLSGIIISLFTIPLVIYDWATSEE
ncbi:sodium-coupled neutral amino acid transporter 1-like, partial [Gracilinanus agilis]|uniref:sodium-coupled neutral amino acid transporter 1-like n=1 Tax=Gracilinanus agilis TaxID=191870 RepID=UPI001CFF10FA